VGNPWGHLGQFDRDRIQRDVSAAQQLRRSHGGPPPWSPSLHEVQRIVSELDVFISKLHDQRRPGESGSPRTQGKDSAEGLAVRALDKVAKNLEQLGKVGKQKASTLVPGGPGGTGVHAVHAFEAVLAIAFALRALMQRFFFDRRVLEQAQRKGERLESAAKVLYARLR
jgi:hypothetical protein